MSTLVTTWRIDTDSQPHTVLAMVSAGFITSELPSGLRVISYEVPGAQSVALCVGFGAGSAHEAPSEAGWAHLLEHLQASVDATVPITRERVHEMKARGAEFNASTESERTSYTVTVARRFWPEVSAIVADAISRPSLDGASIALERKVVAEEVAQRDSDPWSIFSWNTLRHLFAGTPVARAESEVSYGTPESLALATPERLAAFRDRLYTTHNAWVIAVGAITHAELVAWAATLHLPSGPVPPLPDFSGWRPDPETWIILPDYPQSHIALSWPTVPQLDRRSVAFSLINMWLGHGAGSRLFEEIRARRGLAYTLFTDHLQYSGAGAFQFGLQTSEPGHAEQAIDLAMNLVDGDYVNIGASELRALQQEMAGRLAVYADNPSSLAALANDHVASYGRVRQLDEIIDRFDHTSLDDVRNAWRAYLRRDRAIISRLN